MTHDARESSVESGAPIRLYKFTDGSTTYRYTDADEAQTHEALTYERIPIQSDEVRSSGTLDNALNNVRIPADADLAQLFLIFPPSRVVSLVIYGRHVGETETPVRWAGRVVSCTWEENEAILGCEPYSTQIRRVGLTRRYGLGCPYALYGAACGAAETPVPVIVSSIASLTVTLPTGWDSPHGHAKFRGGVAKWTNSVSGQEEVRRILSTTATTITLDGEIRGLAASGTINVVISCNRQQDDCGNIHSNIVNFGGQSWLTTKNPYRINNYY